LAGSITGARRTLMALTAPVNTDKRKNTRVIYKNEEDREREREKEESRCVKRRKEPRGTEKIRDDRSQLTTNCVCDRSTITSQSTNHAWWRDHVMDDASVPMRRYEVTV
jgi:flagellar biosynthesis/type III secretory pathway M-ring protein FliF/YscJ